MKKNLLFLPLFAALTFAGCSKDDPSEVGGSISDGEPRYLAVTIATTPSLGETTRATERDDVNGSYTGPNGSSYEDGLPDENVVNKVRFYFFTEDGSTVSVRNDGKNYYDYTPAEESGRDPNQTVAKSLEAVVIVNTSEGERLPAAMIAIINPTTDLDKSMSRQDLLTQVGNYTKHENGFMMSNSVYLSTAEEVMDDTVISSAYYCTSEDEAKLNPIRIYVERCMAKVRVQLGAALLPSSAPADGKTGTENLVALKYLDDDKKEQSLKIGEQQVYVELLGWGVDGTRYNSYAVKKLDNTWKNQNGPTGMNTAWNLPQLHRCFWAMNTPHEGNTYYNYNQLHSLPFSGANYTYCNENAQRSTETQATSIVIPARLCDKDGNSLMICEYAGVRFVDDDECMLMKKQVLFRLQNSETYFWTKKTGTDGTVTWREIEANDIEFTSVVTDTPDPNGGNYYAKAKLTSAAQQLEWYKSKPVAGAEQVKWSAGDIAKIFDENFNRIKIWKDGMTYYAMFIPHLGEAGTSSAYGVVRNHVYSITLDNVYGLGTPVYNPEQVIIPEKVTADNVFVAAQVELLSWRLISNNVTLDWGK